MPKIKLSALASDIKGKSQGSVFSSNSGGTYFRNNPSGGGKKTAKWGKQKASFAELASQWKALSTEVQDSWNAAVNDYPTINAFGDPRIPSGYELFMRLNGSLKAIGADLLRVPLSPQEMPIIPDVEIGILDEYLYTPNKVLALQFSANRSLAVGNNEFFIAQDFTQSTAISCRFIPDKNYTQSMSPNSDRPLMRIESSDKLIPSLWLYTNPGGQLSIVSMISWLTDTLDDYTQVQVYPVPQDLLSSDFSVMWSFDIQTVPASGLILDGLAVVSAAPFYVLGQYGQPSDLVGIPTVSPPGDAPQDYTNQPASFMVGKNVYSSDVRYMISDLRMLRNTSTFGSCSVDADCLPGFKCIGGVQQFGGKLLSTDTTIIDAPLPYLAIAKGYITGFENRVYDFGTFSNNKFQQYGTGGNFNDLYLVTEPECVTNEDCSSLMGATADVECQGGSCVYVGDSTPFIKNNPVVYGPLVSIAGFAPEAGTYSLIMKSTGPVSNGKDFKQSKHMKFAVIPLIGENYLMSKEFQSLFGNVGGGSAFDFEPSVINVETGQQYDTVLPVAKPPKGNVRRFKAGAELSGKVT